MVRQSMMLVLAFLAESGPAKSGEVGKGLGLKPKHASMVLSRCADRGFVSRRPYKSGRVRGYIYELSDKGAKWILYKASRKTKDEHYDHRFKVEVGNKNIHLPKFKTLNLKQKQQSIKDPMLTEVKVPFWSIWTSNVCAREYQLLKQQHNSLTQLYDLAIILLRKRSSERDFIYYLYRQLEAKIELLQKTQHEKTRHSPESSARAYESFSRGLDHGIEIGLKLGIQVGEFNQIVRTQATVDRVLLRKISRSS